ncbi:TonB-dependent receptor [Erythrobacter aureus]|uniref:TonB-dependent receptor n=1 Tax=Erythrobacter aureus TaxID=2182384 RepID=A0A345YH97_9SPHN|nr:TonB-dependent receptor [Erythrobacter aureus]AXK43299.1 TonB-dependent receptor [Erythrobacter aureus]
MSTKLKRTLSCGCAIAAVSLAISGPVNAQETDVQEADAQGASEAEGDVIIVTGFRASLDSANAIKRNNVAVSEAIVAEDIGKFPDLNLAEALQRTTGITITRDNGEGQQISLRGLGPEFTRVQLNGMSVSSASIGGTDQNALGREFDFDLFPSELFNRIDVAKSPTADLEEGGISGNISLRTARPFDFDYGTTVTASAQLGYSDLPDEFDPRGHVLVSHRGDSWGVTLQAAYSERTVRVDGASSVDWTTPNLGGSFDISFPADTNVAPALQAELQDTLFPRLPRTEFQLTERERLGLAGALEFRPTDDTSLSLDLVYATLSRNTLRSNLDAVFRSQGDIEVVDATVSDGAIATGTFRNVERRAETRQLIEDTDIWQVALSGEHRLADNLVLSGLVGYSESEYDNPVRTTWLYQVVDSEVMLDFTEDPRLPGITSNVDLTDPANYSPAALRIRGLNGQDEVFTSKFDLEWGDDDANLQFGGFLNIYEKSLVFIRNDRAISGPGYSTISQLLPADNFAGDLGNNGQFPAQYLIADPALGNSVQFNAGGDMVTTADLYAAAPVREADTFAIEEQTYGGYLAGNAVTELAGMPLSVNVGVRVVQTDQTSDGFSNGEAVSIDNSYFDILPSANLKLDVTDNLVLRAAFGQSMTRPSLQALRPNTSVRIGNTGSGGNPTLQPFRSRQIDLGAEYYFDSGAVLAIAGFYKSIDGFIVNEAEEVSLRDLGIPLSSLDPQGFEGVTLDTLFTISRPVNSSDPTEVKGIEIAYQQPLDQLLDGLGFIANYTYVDSSVEALSGVVTINTTLPGLSKHSYNLTGYYETDAYSLRVSYNYRDDFVESTFIRDRTGLLRTREGAGFLDLSASVNVTDNVAVTFEGINLLNTNEYTFTGRPELFNRYITAGRQFFFGLRANF